MRMTDDPARLLDELERVAGLGMWAWHAGEGPWWSRGLYRLLDVSPSVTEGLEELFRDRVHPHDRARAHGFAEALRAGRGSGTEEFRLVLPSGVRWVRAHGAILQGEGGPTVLGALVDITELSTALEAASVARWSLAEAQRVARVGFFAHDTTTGVMEWSDELKDICGLPRDEPLTMEVAESFTHPDDLPARARWARTIVQGVPDVVRTRIIRRDGVERTVEYAGVARMGPSGLTRVVGTVRDITDELELTERLRHTSALEAVGSLAAGVAHDVNNALAVISSSLDVVLDARLSSDARDEVLADARRAVSQCATLTQQLLAFGRRQPGSPRVVDVTALVTSFGAMFGRLGGDEVVLSMDAPHGALYARVDPGHLEAALMNLAVNGRDAMPGGGLLAFTVRRVLPGAPRPPEVAAGAMVAITVRDTGAGIPRELVPHLFRPYFTTKHTSRGTGLGLASVLGSMAQASGAVTVSSEQGQGSTFTLWLPEVNAPLSEAALPSPTGGDRGRVLLVDDMELVRRSIARVLEGLGFEVVEAPDGATAVELLARTPVDVVLSDLAMPGIGGAALARLARERGHLQPFVFMTGYADPGGGPDAVSHLGPVLLKPTPPDVLLRALEAALASGKGRPHG